MIHTLALSTTSTRRRRLSSERDDTRYLTLYTVVNVFRTVFGQMVQSQLASSPDAGAFLGDEALDGSGSGDGSWRAHANSGPNDDEDEGEDDEASGSGMGPTMTSRLLASAPRRFASIIPAGVLPAEFHCPRIYRAVYIVVRKYERIKRFSRRKKSERIAKVGGSGQGRGGSCTVCVAV